MTQSSATVEVVEGALDANTSGDPRRELLLLLLVQRPLHLSGYLGKGSNPYVPHHH
jgi:hypothetical protein